MHRSVAVKQFVRDVIAIKNIISPLNETNIQMNRKMNL